MALEQQYGTPWGIRVLEQWSQHNTTYRQHDLIDGLYQLISAICQAGQAVDSGECKESGKGVIDWLLNHQFDKLVAMLMWDIGNPLINCRWPEIDLSLSEGEIACEAMWILAELLEHIHSKNLKGHIAATLEAYRLLATSTEAPDGIRRNDIRLLVAVCCVRKLAAAHNLGAEFETAVRELHIPLDRISSAESEYESA